MKSALASALSLSLLLGATAPALAAPATRAPSTLATESPADAAFRAIYEKEWKWRQAETGQADEDSDTTGDNPRLPDVSAAAQQARLKVWDGVLAQLDKLDAARLSPARSVRAAGICCGTYNPPSGASPAAIAWLSVAGGEALRVEMKFIAVSGKCLFGCAFRAARHRDCSRG